MKKFFPNIFVIILIILNGSTIVYAADPPVLSINFNDGTADDQSVNGNNGIVYGADYTATGGHDNSGGFNYLYDNSDYIEVPDDNTLDITEDVTMAAWVKFDPYGPNVWEGIISKWDNTNGKTYSISRSDDNKFSLGYYSATGETCALRTSGTLNDDQWYHIVGVKSGTALSMYVDGSLASSYYVVPQCSTSTMPVNTIPVSIGAYDTAGDATPNYLNGTIDDVRIFAEALDSTEISNLYNESSNPVGSVPEFNDYVLLITILVSIGLIVLMIPKIEPQRI